MILVICTVKWENKKKLFLIYFIVQQWVQKKMYEIKICFNKTNDFKMFWLNKQTKEMMSNNWKQNFNRMKSLNRIFKKKQNVTRTKPTKKQQHQLQQQQEKNMWIFKTNDKPMQNFKDHKYYVVWRIFHVKQKKNSFSIPKKFRIFLCFLPHFFGVFLLFSNFNYGILFYFKFNVKCPSFSWWNILNLKRINERESWEEKNRKQNQWHKKIVDGTIAKIKFNICIPWWLNVTTNY